MVNPIQFTNPQAYSGGVDFTPLANLGNVYKEAQQRAMQEQALGQLGTDPVANSQMLIKSGVPSLAQLGVQMQNRLATQAEDVRQFNISQGTREEQLKLAKEKFSADSPEYRTKQLDSLIAAGRLPPEAKNDPAWVAWQATGQNIPSGAIVTPQTAADRKAIRDADQEVLSIGQTIGQIDTLKSNMEKAFHLGPLTGAVGKVASFLPEGYGKESGVATELASSEALQQMINQVKNAFGARPSNKEDAWLLKAGASINAAPEVQKQLLNDAKKLLLEKQKLKQEEALEMRPTGVKGYYGRDYQKSKLDEATPTAPTPPASPEKPPVTAAAKPSLKEFMDKNRPANPGVPESELAAYWKKKYGG